MKRSSLIADWERKPRKIVNHGQATGVWPRRVPCQSRWDGQVCCVLFRGEMGGERRGAPVNWGPSFGWVDGHWVIGMLGSVSLFPPLEREQTNGAGGPTVVTALGGTTHTAQGRTLPNWPLLIGGPGLLLNCGWGRACQAAHSLICVSRVAGRLYDRATTMNDDAEEARQTLHEFCRWKRGPTGIVLVDWLRAPDSHQVEEQSTKCGGRGQSKSCGLGRTSALPGSYMSNDRSLGGCKDDCIARRLSSGSHGAVVNQVQIVCAVGIWVVLGHGNCHSSWLFGWIQLAGTARRVDPRRRAAGNRK